MKKNNKQKKYQDDSIVIGKNPVIELLKGNREVKEVYISSSRSDLANEIGILAGRRGIRVNTISKEEIDERIGKDNHQGVFAVTKPYEYSSVQAILEEARIKGEEPFIIILDGIEDPHNFGAIARTSECVGADGIIISKNRSCGITPTVYKTSAGAIENIKIARVTNIGRTIDELKESGVWIAACDMNGEDFFESNNLDGSVAIVIGNEGRGISRLIKEKCDFTISIPIQGKINSLNASNAAAIVMYEIRRRRRQDNI